MGADKNIDVIHKTDLIKQVWRDDDNPAMTRRMAEIAVDAVINAIKDSLLDGKRVHIHGLGTLEPIVSKPRMGRNPATGEPIQVPAKTTIKFKVSRDMKRELND